MDSTLATLLADVRRKGAIPSHAGTGSADSDLIAHLNDCLVSVASEVIKCREGFYRAYKDHTITSSLRYRIPTRAIGNRLASVLLLDSAGKVLSKLDEIPYSRLPEMGALSTGTMGYHLEAGDVVLTPAIPSGVATTLRMVYYARPGLLSSSLDAASGNCFTVTVVNGNVLTLMASHGITTSTRVDIMKKEPPCEYLSIDELPSATASTTVTVADGSRVEVGDFVCLADKAPKPQCPDAFYPVLAASAALEFWSALGSGEDVKRLMALLNGPDGRTGLKGDAVSLIAPRVEENARKIVSIYGALGRVRR